MISEACLLLTGLALRSFELSQIKDAVGNEYGKAKDIVGETRLAFTSLADTAFDVCFENLLVSRRMIVPCFYPVWSTSETYTDTWLR
jgi:hypothetical protein